jgi:hypothetical protein
MGEPVGKSHAQAISALSAAAARSRLYARACEIQEEARKRATEPTTYAVLQQFSRGEITRYAAMKQLGLEWYGELLSMLEYAGLPVYCLPKERLDAMVKDLVQLLSEHVAEQDARAPDANDR